ncbi:MAG: DUF1559 domain-containing protein [Planctomycetaceae bacterium]|nr:DUF1559 domain-containing protein [Planctomycetaceae bacterium]
MTRRCVLMMLVAVLAGCSGDSKTKSTADSEGAEKSSEVNPPAGKMKDKVPASSGQLESEKTSQVNKSTDKAVAQQSNDREEDTAKFRQVSRGIQTHHRVLKKFPMATVGTGQINKDLSWRVLVLPYLELNDEYKKFDLTQAWDSSANKPLIDTIAQEAFELGNGNLICAIECDEQPQTFSQIQDGNSYTIALLETPDVKGKQWTSPADLKIADGVKLIKSLPKGEYLLAGFYDGSVQKIYSTEGKDIKDEQIAALFNPRDGLPINWDDFLESK